jgi:hypothetical protein
MEKGGWDKALIDACCCDYDIRLNSRMMGGNNKVDSWTTPPSSTKLPSSIYCGVSAGAIIVGKSMQTACWKVRIRQ